MGVLLGFMHTVRNELRFRSKDNRWGIIETTKSQTVTANYVINVNDLEQHWIFVPLQYS